MYRDLQSFKTYFETLRLDLPEDAPADDFSIRLTRHVTDPAASAAPTPGAADGPGPGPRPEPSSSNQMALHTLPELQLEGEERVGESPTLSVLGTLGEGGMGVVRLASQWPLDRKVAVKTIRAGASEATAQALLQEAYVTGYLEHPNIIPIYMVGRTAKGAPLIVMKRVEGTSWLQHLRDQRDDGSFDLADHIEILIQVCNAVRFSHSHRVLHRDIKPENVMIGHFDEVYLLDWGIAISLDEERARLPHRDEVDPLAGTPAYMAPEMTEKAGHELDERTDVYLLGATLHHVLTGRPRHRGNSLLKVMFAAHMSRPFDYPDTVPDELAAIANKACHRDKDQRFQSVEALRDALHEYLEHRESIALSALAEQKHDELAALVGEADTDAARIHDTYGECRFGFHQALRMWPQNEQAEQGLQRCLETMAGYFLDQQNVDSARACLAEMPQQRPSLAQRADELAAELAAEHQDLERLKKLERNLDLRTATTSRSRMAILLGVVWTATSLWAAWRIHTQDQGHAEQLEHHMQSGLRNIIIVVAAVFAFRKRVFANVANRRMIYMLLAMFVVTGFMRWTAWYTDVNLVAARTVDYVIYILTVFALGLVTDLRIVLLSLSFAAAAVAGLIWPQWQVTFGAIANAMTFGGLAWLWSPSQMKNKVSA